MKVIYSVYVDSTFKEAFIKYCKETGLKQGALLEKHLGPVIGWIKTDSQSTSTKA